jgi:hypothetical protein
MLYNQSTGLKSTERPETIADVMSVKRLIAWLETKPADGTYVYIDGSRCLLTQYLQASGFPQGRVGAFHFFPDAFDRSEPALSLPKDLHDIAFGLNAAERTFGAALQRAKRILEDA